MKCLSNFVSLCLMDSCHAINDATAWSREGFSYRSIFIFLEWTVGVARHYGKDPSNVSKTSAISCFLLWDAIIILPSMFLSAGKFVSVLYFYFSFSSILLLLFYFTFRFLFPFLNNFFKQSIASLVFDFLMCFLSLSFLNAW